MMYCYFCGKENKDEYKFCKYCGKTLHPEMSTKEESIHAPKEEPVSTQKQETAPLPVVETAPLPKVDVASQPKTETGPLPVVDTAPIPKIEPAPAPKQETALLPVEQPQREKKPFNINILLIGVIVFLMIVIGALGVISLKYINDSTNKDMKAESIITEDSSEKEDEDDAEEVEEEDEEERAITVEETDKDPTPLSGRPGKNDREDRYDEEYEEPEEEAEEEPEQEDKKEYVLPDSSTRRLDKSEVRGLTAEECRIARNEIYARHGRKFKDQELQEYFNSKDWYSGTIEPDRFNESVLSSIELDNIKVITEYEKQEGYR